MICEGCGRCRGIKFNNQVYTVSCLENGEFPIHADNIDNFHCNDRTDPIEPPPSDNILIILKSGRDITVYDKDIKCMADLYKMIVEDNLEWVEYGDFTFKVSEIACYGYVGG